MPNEDQFTAGAIAARLETGVLGRDLVILPETDSTNTRMKRDYAMHRAEGFTLFAERQTAGRGRLGRSFLSPEGGLYMTVLLRPKLALSEVTLLTIAAGVAVCGAITETCGFTPSVKWVNDIVHRGKKLCGILTEASISGEDGTLAYAIVGIGINLRFDAAGNPDLAQIAGGLSDFAVPPSRAVLAAAVLKHLERQYRRLCAGARAAIVADYRALLCCLDRPVTVIENGQSAPAFCHGLDDEGQLLVTMEDGAERTLRTGEISIRL